MNKQFFYDPPLCPNFKNKNPLPLTLGGRKLCYPILNLQANIKLTLGKIMWKLIIKQHAQCIYRAVSRANFILVDQYGCQKNVPKKQKVKLLTLTCLFVKRKFNETHKDFSINYPFKNKCRKTISVFNLPSTKLQNTLESNSLDKPMQLVSIELLPFWLCFFFDHVS